MLTREKQKEKRAEMRPTVKFIMIWPSQRIIVTISSSSRRPPTPKTTSQKVMRLAKSLPLWYACGPFPGGRRVAAKAAHTRRTEVREGTRRRPTNGRVRAARVPPEQWARTPLFGPKPGAAFTHHQVERAFELMLLHGARLAPEELHNYSIHSFRIFVACYLKANKVSRHDIKRLVRWLGDDLLELYARLNDVGGVETANARLWWVRGSRLRGSAWTVAGWNTRPKCEASCR